MRIGNNKVYALAGAILFISVCAGCAIRSVYVPLTVNAPLFDTSKQLKASGFLGSNHAELQIAHNPANHFAVAGNIEYGTGISAYNCALGVYAHDNRCRWRYELFGGYGYNTNIAYDNGNVLSSSQKVSYDVSSLYHQVYLQPSVGFTGRINMYKIKYSFSLSSRLSYLHFAEYLYREKDLAKSSPAVPVYIVDKEYHNKAIYTFEPCLSNKVGIRNVSAILQVQAVTPYSEEIDVSNTKFSPVIFFSFGIQYVFTFKVKQW